MEALGKRETEGSDYFKGKTQLKENRETSKRVWSVSKKNEGPSKVIKREENKCRGLEVSTRKRLAEKKDGRKG